MFHRREKYKIKDEDVLLNIVAKLMSVRDCCCCRLVDDCLDLEPGDFSCIDSCLPLELVEVGGNGDHCSGAGPLISEIVVSVALESDQYHG